MKRTALLILVGLSLSVGACKKGTPAEGKKEPPQARVAPVRSLVDFAQICEGKTVTSPAAAYSKQDGKASPVVFLIKDFKQTSYVESKWESSKPWAAKDPASAQLVVCLDVQKSEKKRECNLQGSILEQHAATMKISVFEAKTGKKLEENTIEKPEEQGCPRSFWFTSQRQIYYGDVGILLGRAVAKYQPADAPPLNIPVWDFRFACQGQPVPGAKAYTKTPGAKNVPAVFFDRGDGLFWEAEGVFKHGEWSERRKQAGTHKSHVNAVVCMTAERQGKPKSCRFYGHPPLQVYSADWTVSLVDPATAKPIASTKMKGGSASCPTLWKFSNGAVHAAPPPDVQVVRFLRPFLDP